jgi:hypothetical protein
MSSRQPDPDDEDTGPLPVDRLHAPAGGTAPRYNAPLSVNPRPVHRDRRPVVLIAAATAAVVGLGALAWAFWPSSGGEQDAVADATTTTEAEAAEQAQARLLAMVPRGYAEGACETVVPAKGALAQVSCGKNDDPGGPLTATYTLARDKDSLKELFDGLISSSSVVNCPGNIQSPGPWRRNVAAEETAGTLVCGFAQSRPTVAWTTDADVMMSEIQSGPQGPNMVQIYTWWASHS